MKPTFRDVQHLRRALRGAIRDLRVLMGDLQEAFDELPAERADFSDASVVELSDACEHAESLLDDLRGCDAFEAGDIHGVALATLDAIGKYFDELRDDAPVYVTASAQRPRSCGRSSCDANGGKANEKGAHRHRELFDAAIAG